MDIELGDNKYDFDTYITKLGEVNGPATVAILNDHSVFHSITKSNIFHIPTRPQDHSVFSFNNRYSSETFQGIMPDSGAAGVSTARENQVIAL